MNKELVLRTFAYLNGHYKTHNETTITRSKFNYTRNDRKR